MYIFLDESGDLGFDFTKKGTSKFFIMTILVSADVQTIKSINLAANKTLKKINHKKKKNLKNELKGTEIPLPLKQYFLNKVNNTNWSLHAAIVNKTKFSIPKYIKHPKHLYDYIAAHLLNTIIIDITPQSKIIINTDKCKMAHDIYEFNRKIESIFYPKLINANDMMIQHKSSKDDKLLQAMDLFCSGLFAKYEHKDLSWYSCFKNKSQREEKL